MTMKKSEALKKTDLRRFKKILEEKKEQLIKSAKESLHDDMRLDTNDLPDEMDLASSEYFQSLTFRMRGRERFFLDKIDKALARIEDASFGICETCEEPISIKRLEARPETTLCIKCKEDQERVERDFG
jgi:DnaK suppressor protein